MNLSGWKVSEFSNFLGSLISHDEQHQPDGEVVSVEVLDLLHGGQVNVDEVPGLVFVQNCSLFVYLICFVMISFVQTDK